jgi:hypothetical protein
MKPGTISSCKNDQQTRLSRKSAQPTATAVPIGKNLKNNINANVTVSAGQSSAADVTAYVAAIALAGVAA